MKKLIQKAISSLKREKILYYPGCLTSAKYPLIIQRYKSMLHDSGVDFVILPELSCCGSPLLNAGYLADFDQIKTENKDILTKNKITKIITNCPNCYKTFKKDYKLDADHITKFLSEKKYSPQKEEGSVIYHDSCMLVNEGIVKEPRELIRKKGYSIKEPVLSRKNTFCCGAGFGLIQNNPDLANKIAKERLSQLNSNKIVTACPYCYTHLKNNNTDKDKEIIEISELIFEE